MIVISWRHLANALASSVRQRHAGRCRVEPLSELGRQNIGDQTRDRERQQQRQRSSRSGGDDDDDGGQQGGRRSSRCGRSAGAFHPPTVDAVLVPIPHSP